jgi:crotonobetainyl-CoA:carnitine CoA-transferase CaiB-like acyl-CoA transferase
MLDDLRVAELSCTYAGAIAGRLMVDAGAEVILLEPPGGHPLRMQGPFRADLPDPETCAWHLHANAGKRSVVRPRLGSRTRPPVVLSAETITDLPWRTDT